MKLPSKQGESKILKQKQTPLSHASQLLFLVCWFPCPLFSSLFITPLLTSDSNSGFIKEGHFTPKASLPLSVGTQGWPGRRELTCVLWSLEIQVLPHPDQKPTSPANRRILAFLWSGSQVSVPGPRQMALSWEAEEGVASLRGSQVERW